MYRSGQSQVLTAVILGGIMISAITAAYIWGLPILQKNQDVNTIEGTLNDLRSVSDAISTVAQEGGARSATINLGKGIVQIDPVNDTITFRSTTRGAYVSTNDWVPLNENDLQGVPGTAYADSYGIRGTDSLGVLAGKSRRVRDGFLTTYKIAFRPLKDPNSKQTYKVDLVKNGKMHAAGGGDHEIVFQKGQDEVEPGSGVQGGTLRRMEVRIRVS